MRINFTKNYKCLDVGCGKGFMLYDFKQAIPQINISGIDISKLDNLYDLINEIKNINDNVYIILLNIINNTHNYVLSL